MTAALKRFFDDLDKAELRVSHPYPLIFLCGGKTKESGPPESLRDYIHRIRKITLGTFRIVLAEQANQLYRDTGYPDLITFEEDIARIASLVVIVAESAGSLAELGAFASSPAIRPMLRVLVQEEYASDESFIRHGPIERLRKQQEDSVGVFPWKTHKTGRLIGSSVTPHADEISTFLTDHMKRVPASTHYSALPEAQQFFLVYWIIYLGLALPHAAILSCMLSLDPTFAPLSLRDKIYCMELAGWVGRKKYSGKEYFYALDGDPFDYRFKPGVAARDSLRRKTQAIQSIAEIWKAPRYIREAAVAARGFQL